MNEITDPYWCMRWPTPTRTGFNTTSPVKARKARNQRKKMKRHQKRGK